MTSLTKRPWSLLLTINFAMAHVPEKFLGLQSRFISGEFAVKNAQGKTEGEIIRDFMNRKPVVPVTSKPLCSNYTPAEANEVKDGIATMEKICSGNASAENHSLYAYMLSLKGKCEGDKLAMKKAIVEAERALAKDPKNERALAFIARTVVTIKMLRAVATGAQKAALLLAPNEDKLFARHKDKIANYLNSAPNSELREFISQAQNFLLRT